ncbi:MAG: Qat anti-phage system QueC-like protein QatC [Woeseia sp.]
MKVVCGPSDTKLGSISKRDLRVILYGFSDKASQGSIGASLLMQIRRARIMPAARAWDLLSIALSVIAADTAVRRGESPDGWTRQIDLKVAVSDPPFWRSQAALIQDQLRFLTTDIWNVEFAGAGMLPAPPKNAVSPLEKCIALLSGGLDSFIGVVDLVAANNRPYAVSQVATGDKQLQSFLASQIAGGLTHLQLNHNVSCPGENERSQRSRSLIFLAYGVLAATSLKRYKDGKDVDLYVCENGFISINPPLTGARLGSLSTRTTHPIFLNKLQELLDAAGLRVKIRNPYQFKTKGEMLSGCKDQALLLKYAADTTSCGRYARNGYQHCGRCLPCLIRRSSFLAWGKKDKTGYVYARLAKDDEKHARFDDVRCAAMAVAQVKREGIDSIARANLNSVLMGNTAPYKAVLKRGITELERFLASAGVK